MKNYSDEEIKKLEEEYQKILDENPNMSWKDFAKKINSLHHKDKIYFQTKMLGEFFNFEFCGITTHYDENFSIDDEADSYIIFNTIELLPKDSYYWWGIYYFFKNDKKNLIKCIDNYISGNVGIEINESEFVVYFLVVYKNAYCGFWKKLSELFKKYNVPNGEKLSNLFEDFYYNCKNYDEKENLLVNYVQDNPETILAKEFLGELYCDEKIKRWYNAIPMLEQVAGKSVFYFYEDIYFDLAWCYGKVKNYVEEEKNYRKCLELNPNYQNYGLALNNLGYLLYKQHRLDEAEKLILKCLDEELETYYAPNNLVRIYLAKGQVEKAKKFIATKKFKVSKSLVDKVKKYSSKNNFIDEEISDDEGIAENKKFYRGETKIEQFTSEKILEDELVMRLESGKEIFGLNLKIYHGDFYGRQYPFFDGKNKRRLDILCEDDQGNFYIIELKKDSGYGDAYRQIKNYVDYFEKNRVKKGKKVFGILCLNSPTEKLLQDVRKDKRIRLFEYKISYDELI